MAEISINKDTIADIVYAFQQSFGDSAAAGGSGGGGNDFIQNRMAMKQENNERIKNVRVQQESNKSFKEQAFIMGNYSRVIKDASGGFGVLESKMRMANNMFAESMSGYKSHNLMLKQSEKAIPQTFGTFQKEIQTVEDVAGAVKEIGSFQETVGALTSKQEAMFIAKEKQDKVLQLNENGHYVYTKKVREAAIAEQKNTQKTYEDALGSFKKTHKILYSQNKKSFEQGKLLRDENTKLLKSMNNLNNKVAEFAETMKAGFLPAMDKAIDAGKSLAGSFFNVKAGIAVFMKGFIQGVNDLETSMKVGTKTSDGLFEHWDNAARMGISPEELSNINAEFRQAMMGMTESTKDGTSWNEKLAGSQEEYFNLFGSNLEAVRYSAQVMNTLGTSGVNMAEGMAYFTTEGEGSMKDFRDRFGMAGTEYAAQLADFAADENIRNKMLGAQDDVQRKQILKGVMARNAEMRALGMTKDQAIAASKALASIQGKKATDRIEQAAKARAAMSAAGIEGGADVQRIIMKGQSATEAERAKVGDALAKLKEFGTEAAMSGDIGKEIFADNIATLTTELASDGGIFSTKLNKQLEQGKDANKYLKSLTDALPEWATEGIKRFEEFKSAVASSPMYSMAVGALQIVGGLIVGLAGIGAVGALLGPLLTILGSGFMILTTVIAPFILAGVAMVSLYEMMTTGTSTLYDTLTSMFPDAMKAVGYAVFKTVEEITGWFDWVADGAKNALSSVTDWWKAVMGAWDSLVNFFKHPIDSVKSYAKDLLGVGVDDVATANVNKKYMPGADPKALDAAREKAAIVREEMKAKYDKEILEQQKKIDATLQNGFKALNQNNEQIADTSQKTTISVSKNQIQEQKRLALTTQDQTATAV